MNVAELREWIRHQMVAFAVPGAAVALVKDGEVLLQEGFGHRDVAQGEPVETDTAFALASVTKAFTAAGVGVLVDEGLIGWDEPVRRYLPDFELRDHVATERLTVRDMLSHRSGLPRHDIVWYGDRSTDRGALVRRLRHLEPSKDLRTAFQYNNLMYAAAGHLCEVVTGGSWEDLLRSRLLEPLGMEATTFDHDKAATLGPVALPYATVMGETSRIPYTPASYLTGPAGSLYSTLDDMVVWLRVLLGVGRLDDRDVIAPAAVRTTLAPQMAMPEAGLYPETRDTAYGMGWVIGTYRGHKIAHHGGGIDGFASLVAVLPDDGIGLVCLVNKGGTSFPVALSFHALDEALGLDALPWDQRVLELEQTRRAGVQAAQQRTRGSGLPAPAHPLADYAGQYEHPAYGRFDVAVSADGEGLTPHFRDLTARLSHRHYETFDLEIDPWETERWTVTFRTDVDGAVDALIAPLEPTVAPIVFDRRPDAELTDPAQLARLEGRYAMGPIEVTVRATRPDRLGASVAGQAPLALIPHLGGAFKLEGNDMARVRFEQADDGSVSRLVLHPVGVFLPVADD